MGQFVRDFHYFRPHEKRGLIVLAVIVVALVVANILFRSPDSNIVVTLTAGNDTVVSDTAVRRGFVASVGHDESRRTQRRGGQAARQAEDPADAAGYDPVPFDPNTADSATLRRVGLSAWTARNVIRYRQAGGRFRKADDLRKIYGMDSLQYGLLADYVRIENNDSVVGNRTQVRSLLLSAEEKAYTKVEKYEEGTLVNLNLADTTELKKIPGIGSWMSRKIVEYRDQLGGYRDVQQLREMRVDADAVERWFVVDTTLIRKIPVSAGYRRLVSHPYINGAQAREIVKYRRVYGHLYSLEELGLLDVFTESDIERITPYLQFDEE